MLLAKLLKNVPFVQFRSTLAYLKLPQPMKKEFWQDRAHQMELEQNRIIDQIERIEAGKKKIIIRPHLRFLNRVMDRLDEARGNCQP